MLILSKKKIPDLDKQKFILPKNLTDKQIENFVFLKNKFNQF
jgi:hypothetical protein